MKIFGVTLFSTGFAIIIVGVVLYGNHGLPYQGSPDSEEVKLYAADGVARLESFLRIGGTLFLLGLFVSLTALIGRALTAKWVLITNVLLCMVSASFWVSSNMDPGGPFAVIIFLNAILAPLALPFTLGRWMFLRRSTP